MRNEISAHELAARLILGELKATRSVTHAVAIDSGTISMHTHFGTSGSNRCQCCGGSRGSAKIEIQDRACVHREVLVFIVEPALDGDQMRLNERELCGDALAVLAEHVNQLGRVA